MVGAAGLAGSNSQKGETMKRFLIAVLLASMPVLAFAGTPTAAPITNSDKTVIGQTITSPEHPFVKTTMVTFLPGDKTGIHKHPYPHYGYMLEGVLTVVNTETGKSFDLKAGEFLVEMANTAHYGENRGSVPVKLLVIDSLPAADTNNSIPVAP